MAAKREIRRPVMSHSFSQSICTKVQKKKLLPSTTLTKWPPFRVYQYPVRKRQLFRRSLAQVRLKIWSYMNDHVYWIFSCVIIPYLFLHKSSCSTQVSSQCLKVSKETWHFYSEWSLYTCGHAHRFDCTVKHVVGTACFTSRGAHLYWCVFI